MSATPRSVNPHGERKDAKGVRHASARVQHWTAQKDFQGDATSPAGLRDGAPGNDPIGRR